MDNQNETGPPPFTFFMCGPSKDCKHEWGEEMVGTESGWTAVCVKCGARAINEAMWD